MKRRLFQIALLLALVVSEVGAQQVAVGGASPQSDQAGQSGKPLLTSGVPDTPDTAQARINEPPPAQESIPPDASVTGNAELERELVNLAATLNARLRQPEKKSLSESFLDFLAKLAALIATIIGCIVSYKGLKKVPAFNDNKEVIALILGTIVLAVVFYCLSGLVTSVLYVLIAILVLLIALTLGVAHLLKFIDEKYPDAKDGIISFFSGSPEGKSVRRLARENISAMQSWLENIVFFQKLTGKMSLELAGSFVAGYDMSHFEIQPDDSLVPHWKNVDGRMLVPVKVRLTVFNSEDKSIAEVVNVQTGVVVVRSQESLHFKEFDYNGQKLVLASFVQSGAEYQKMLAENMLKLNADLQMFNSQSI
jgi:hypothetical protein